MEYWHRYERNRIISVSELHTDHTHDMGDAGPQLTALQPATMTAQSPVPRKLNVGVVGIGRMGRRHALNFLRMVPRANLLCACSPAQPDHEWADEHLRPYGVHIYSTFEQLIETPGLQAVVIASATEFHMQQTLAALDRGIHVLCEKPVCMSKAEVCHECASMGVLALIWDCSILPWLRGWRQNHTQH